MVELAIQNPETKTRNRIRPQRPPGPLRLAFTRAILDWYYALIPFAAMNLVWVGAVVTVVAGPPATAALLAVARDCATGQGAEPSSFFSYLRHFFWRAWGLGLITFLGTVMLVTDIFYYAGALNGNSLLLSMGVVFLLYLLIVWVELLLLAWPLLVNQEEMSIRDVIRNAAILAFRMPAANFGLVLLVFVLCILSLAVAFLLAVGFTAFVALLVQHYLHIQAPVLANFPPVVGEEAEPIDQYEGQSSRS